MHAQKTADASANAKVAKALPAYSTSLLHTLSMQILIPALITRLLIDPLYPRLIFFLLFFVLA